MFEGANARAVAVLNGQRLGEVVGASKPARFDVTAVLSSHNTLEVDVSLDRAAFGDSALRGPRAGAPGGLVGEVRLEISATK